ncbi:hypothetical protein H6F84_20825 [Microcoleus sp. FACHB-84]|nr:hypothetical protein [Microcoleus sp. FACHB-84]
MFKYSDVTKLFSTIAEEAGDAGCPPKIYGITSSGHDREYVTDRLGIS